MTPPETPMDEPYGSGGGAFFSSSTLMISVPRLFTLAAHPKTPLAMVAHHGAAPQPERSVASKTAARILTARQWRALSP